ncbi:MAG: type II secretion system F family protein [Rhodothalassiaceae bacterium]
MPAFRYRIKTADGQYHDGRTEAPDRLSAVRSLAGQDGVLIRLEPERHPLMQVLRSDIRLGSGIGSAQRLAALRELATLLEAGLTAEQGLSLVAETSESARVRRAIEAALDRLRQGVPVSRALAECGLGLGAMEAAMLQAGERSGALVSVLRSIAEHLGRMERLRAELTGALIYPVILILVSLGTILLLVTAVIPQFEPVFDGAGAALPPVTQAVRSVSQFLVEAGPLLAALLAASGLLLLAARRTPAGRQRMDAWVLRAPIVSPLVLDGAMARFAATLATLLRGGVPIERAIAVARGALANQALAVALTRAEERLTGGQALWRALAAEPLFPVSVTGMVRVGEQSNRLERILDELAQLLQERADRRIKRFVALLTPAVTLIMGLVVGLIVWSIMAAVLGVGELVQ